MSASSSSASPTRLSPPGGVHSYHAHAPISSRRRVVACVGTRASALAMIQTNSVVAKLKELFPEVDLPVKKITTTGDKILGVALSKIGEKSLFTKELEVALENRDVDLVVHSLKDLPTTLPPGMVIGAVLKRESPLDACIMSSGSLRHSFARLTDLPKGSVVGTSSLRRIAQLKRLHSGLSFTDIRGNLNTRMKKLDNEEGATRYSALILAEAGMERMGWKERITRAIPAEECMYAVGQGALAIECRDDDLSTLSLLSNLHHETTVYRIVAERAMLKVLEGGCSAPVAVDSDLNDANLLSLRGGVFSLDGSEAIVVCLSTDLGVHLLSEEDQPRRRRRGGEGDHASADAAAPSSSSAKRPRSSRTYSGVVAGVLNEAAMAAAEELGVAVAKRLMEMGAGPVLEAAKAEVEKGRAESERRKKEALEAEEKREKEEEEDKKREKEALPANGEFVVVNE